MDKLLDLFISKPKKHTETRNIVNTQTHMSPDIQQGLEYLRDIHNMCSSLQQSASLIEHFTSMSQSDGPTIESEENKEMQELKVLETRFNKLLSEYSTVYKEYGRQIQRSLQEDSNTYNNKTIMTPDGSGYYVNGFGIARFWSGKAWDSRSSTCPSITHVSTNDIESLGLRKGRPMGEGEPCGFEGSNVRLENVDIGTTYLGCFADNGKTIGLEKSIGDLSLKDCATEANKQGYNYIGYHGTTCYAGNKFTNDGEDEARCGTQGDHRVGSYIYNAMYEIIENMNQSNSIGYVDETNRLRPYQSVEMTNNTGTCPSNTQNILSSDWNAFTRGEPMTESTLCNLGKVDMKDKRELEDINRQLLETANEMYEKIQQLREKYNSYNELSAAQEEVLQKQLGKYRHMYEKIKKVTDNDETIHAMTEDSHLLYKSSHLKFIMWSLLSGLLIIYAIKQIRK